VGVEFVNSTTDGERSNGELPANAPSYADALALLSRYRRLLDGQQLRIAELERQHEETMEAEAGAPQIRDVLNHWREVLMPKAKIVPGSERWTKVKARLKDFDVTELKAVPHGALKDPWYCARRFRLDAKILYRSVESTEELRDLGLGVLEQTLPTGLALPRALGEKLINLNPHEWDALDRCECGHLQFQHLHYCSDGPLYGDHWCSKCECTGFFREYPQLKAVRDEEQPQTGQLGLEAA
jgi:hypothetical protein